MTAFDSKIREMTYLVSVSTVFNLPVERVYEALCFLDDYPLWNISMVRISKNGYLKENMLVETESIVVGQKVVSNFEIVRLVPNKVIEMVNNSGSITYHAMYQLLSESPDESEVICTLRFEFNGFILNLARPIVEGMAESRLRNNMEALQALLRG